MKNNEILSFEEMLNIVSTRIDDAKMELEKDWNEFSEMCKMSYLNYQTPRSNADLSAKAQEIVELITTLQRNKRLIDDLIQTEQKRRDAEEEEILKRLDLEYMSLHFEKDGSEREVDEDELVQYYTEKEQILKRYTSMRKNNRV